MGRSIWLAAGAIVAVGTILTACGTTSAGVATPTTAGTAVDHGTGTSACAGGPTVAASGTGQAENAPDELTMDLGVGSQATSAAAALAKNNAESQSLVSVLEQGGVAAKDLQTTGLSINPVYGKTPGDIVGYHVSDEITATVHSLASVGSLIDQAAAKVGNDVTFGSLSFAVSDPAKPEAAAHTAAVQAAAAHAEAMASAAGVSLGPLCSMSDQGSGQPIRQAFAAAGASASMSAPAVPVNPGQETFTAQVRLTYRIG